MSDTPDKIDTQAVSKAEPSAEELLVLDLLYGELDEVEEIAAREKIDASASASEDFESLSGVRALFAQMVDEEPPAASTARLLHAAANAVPSSRAVPSLVGASPGSGSRLWSGIVEWFRPLMGSPAFAAATMLVVVAGVAGALYLSGDGGNAQPRVASESEAPPRSSADSTPGTALARPAAASPPAPSLDDSAREVGIARDPNFEDIAAGAKPADDGILASDRGGAPLSGKAGWSGASGKTAKSAQKKRVVGRVNKLEAAAGTKRPAGNTARQGRNRDSSRSPSPEPQSKVPPTNGVKSTPAERRVETARPAAKPAPRKPRRTRSTAVSGSAGNSPMVDSEEAVADEAASGPVSEDNGAGGADKSQGGRNSRNVRGLHKRALQAARDGECEAVRSLGTRIRGIDSRYFANSFARDSRLQRCLGTAKAKAKTKKTRTKTPVKK